MWSLAYLLIIRTYAVGVWGRQTAPKDLHFSPQQGDFVALLRRKRMVLGGLQTLQTSRLAGDCVSPVIMRQHLDGVALVHAAIDASPLGVSDQKWSMAVCER